MIEYSKLPISLDVYDIFGLDCDEIVSDINNVKYLALVYSGPTDKHPLKINVYDKVSDPIDDSCELCLCKWFDGSAIVVRYEKIKIVEKGWKYNV
jgi:hypothetical protein